MKNLAKFKLASLISLANVLLTFITDKLYFVYYFNDKVHLLKIIVFKLMLFLILTIFYYFLIKFIKEKLYKKDYFKIFLVVFLIFMFSLILTWPGVFRNDEIGIILYAKSLRIESWHHILISIITILELMILPFPSGVIIINCFLYSLVITYVVYKTAKSFSKIKYRYLFLLIPFFLFPVIENNLYPLRPIIYGYLELFWFSFIYFTYKDKRKINYPTLFMIIILSILLVGLRSEAICYLPLVFIVAFLYLQKGLFDKKKLIIMLSFFLIGYIGINFINNKALLSNYGNSYQLTPAHGFIREAALITKQNNDLEAWKNLSLGFDVSTMIDNNDWVGQYANKEISKKETTKFFKTYYQVVFENFDLYLKERLTTYQRTNGFVKNWNTSIFTTYNLFDKNKDSSSQYAYNMLKNTKGLFIKPLNKDIRKAVICFLEAKNKEGQTNFLFPILWNSLIPTFVVLLFSILCLFKKKYLAFLFGSFNLLKTILIFITAPDSFFMYYFSIYLIGYFLLIVMILSIVDKRLKL